MGEIPQRGQYPAGEKPHGEYLCSLSVKITAENTANLFSEFIFEFKNMFKQNNFFFFTIFYSPRDFFPIGKIPYGVLLPWDT